MDIFGVGANAWGETVSAAQDVVLKRLMVFGQCDQAAIDELERAVSEKLSFFGRWSLIFMATGWMGLDGPMARMAQELRAEIVGNRDRLATSDAPNG